MRCAAGLRAAGLSMLSRSTRQHFSPCSVVNGSICGGSMASDAGRPASLMSLQKLSAARGIMPFNLSSCAMS